MRVFGCLILVFQIFTTGFSQVGEYPSRLKFKFNAFRICNSLVKKEKTKMTFKIQRIENNGDTIQYKMDFALAYETKIESLMVPLVKEEYILVKFVKSKIFLDYAPAVRSYFKHLTPKRELLVDFNNEIGEKEPLENYFYYNNCITKLEAKSYLDKKTDTIFSVALRGEEVVSDMPYVKKFFFSRKYLFLAWELSVEKNCQLFLVNPVFKGRRLQSLIQRILLKE